VLLLALAILGCAACGLEPAPRSSAPRVTGPAMRLHAIDVGQGAATLIEFSCGAILVDTGGEDNRQFSSAKHLMQYLDAFFASRPELNRTLALLVLTHPDLGHDRNAMAVWSSYHVKTIITDGIARDGLGGPEQAALVDAAGSAGVSVREVAAKSIPVTGLHDDMIDPIACKDGTPDIRVLWGGVERGDVTWNDDAFADANNHSVVLRVTLGKSSVLITGDLDSEGIAGLVAKYAGTDALRADVYEVGDHGSLSGTTRELLDAVHPKLAVIAMGSERRDRRIRFTAYDYGDPREIVVEMLEAVLSGAPRRPIRVGIAREAQQFEHREVKAPIYATGWDGNVAITLGADGTYDVVTQHGEP
jgi:competence protein ComEC